jgi:DNA-binding IclR family transcriptional regulator
MAQLAAETGQTTHLAVWDGQRLMFLARKLGKHGLDQPHAAAGSRLPAHCTASGKVLLADLPWAEVIERIGVNDSTLVDFRTSRSLRDVTRLRAELEQVRRIGVGYNRAETDKGVAALAAPVRDGDGRAVAALGVSVPIAVFEPFRERYEPLLKRMADSLTRSLAEAEGQQRVEWAGPAQAPVALQRALG